MNKKKKQVVEKFKKLKEEQKGNEATQSMIGNFLSKITRPLATFELDHEQRMEIEALEEENNDSRTNLNITFNVLSSYLHYLSQFRVPLEVSKSMLLYFCERYELDKDRTQLLLSELESTYSKEGLTDQEISELELKRAKQVKDSLENNQKMIILYNICKYINDDETLIKILRLSKA